MSVKITQFNKKEQALSSYLLSIFISKNFIFAESQNPDALRELCATELASQLVSIPQLFSSPSNIFGAQNEQIYEKLIKIEHVTFGYFTKKKLQKEKIEQIIESILPYFDTENLRLKTHKLGFNWYECYKKGDWPPQILSQL